MRWLTLLLLFLFTGCQSHLTHRTVILVSIDAFRPDYLNRGLTPNLQWLADHGVRAEWMIPSFPTETYPNHYAMVTGLYPDHNGVVANELSVNGVHATLTARESTGLPLWYEEATPIWVTLHNAGGHSATMLWPGSEAPNHGIRPDHWLPYNISITADARVDHVLKWLRGNPNFVALYFDKADYNGHLYGPDSPRVDAAIRNIDRAIGRLIAGAKGADIIIVSDHGMSALRHTIYLDDYTSAHIAFTGGVAGIDGQAPKLPHAQCWNKHDIPARFHYGTNDRIPQTVCLAEDGWMLTTHSDAKHDRGQHGYDNADPNMRAIFIAYGPDFKKGYISAPFPNVDVYPLLAHLIGIRPERNDGNLNDVKAMLLTRD